MSALRAPHVRSTVVQAVATGLFAIVGGVALVTLLESKVIIGVSLLLTLLIPVAALLSGNPRLFCLMGLMLFAPLDLSKYFYSYPHFGGEFALRIEATDAFILLLCFFWFRDLITGRQKTIRVPLGAFYWGLLMVLGVATVYFVVYRNMAAYEEVRMFKMFLIVMYIANNVVRPRQMLLIAGALIAGVLFQSSYALLQYTTGWSFGLERLGEAPKLVTEQLGMLTASRVGAMLGHPNMFASYLVMLLPLAFALLFAPVSRFFKGMCLVTLALGSLSLILTLCRGGWIGFLLAIIGLLLLSFFHPLLRREAILLRVYVVGGVASLAALMSGPIILKLTLSDPASILSRFELMRNAWRMIKSNILLGVGLNSYTFAANKYDYSGIMWGDLAPPVHNIYLLVAAEQGVIGFALFATMLFVIIRGGIRNLQCKDPVVLTINAGCLAGCCAVLVQALADWTLRVNAVQRIFMILIALMSAIEFWDKANATSGAPAKEASAAAAVPSTTMALPTAGMASD